MKIIKLIALICYVLISSSVQANLTPNTKVSVDYINQGFLWLSDNTNLPGVPSDSVRQYDDELINWANHFNIPIQGFIGLPLLFSSGLALP